MKKSQKTYMQRKEDVTREWHLVDAKNEILGKLATKIAIKLIGKHKPTYTPHTEAGDYVVVINAKEIAVTRNKEQKKLYRDHSMYPGGLTERSLGEMRLTQPEEILRRAVINMLPKNRLRDLRMARLKIYAGPEHKQQSQLGAK